MAVQVRSYELGVLLTPSLEARYRASTHAGFSVFASEGSNAGGGNSSSTHSRSSRFGGAIGVTVVPQLTVTFWSPAATREEQQHNPQQLLQLRQQQGSDAARVVGGSGGGGEAVPVVLPVPYVLPPVPYRQGTDVPWMVDEPQTGRDALGKMWGEPKSHYGFMEPGEDEAGELP